jgi:Glu-tRNA(Gln) amidotransferase subunit E-like FAD-binding protein
LKKINNIDTPLANLIKMRRQKAQISKIRNKKWKVTTNTMEIQGIIRDDFENLYSNKLEDLEEIYKFLSTYGHQKLIQEAINQLNRSITHNEIETAIKSLKNRNVQDLMDSLLNSTRP